MAAPQRTGVPFKRFGGIRLDQSIDEVGSDEAIFLEDVDWGDQDFGLLRPRDGAVKSGGPGGKETYKGAFAHSNTYLLLALGSGTKTKKIVAVDETISTLGEIAVEFTGRPSFARIGTPASAYSYIAAGTGLKVVRFDGSALTFSQPTATVDGVAGKAMPKANYLAVWPDGDNRLIACSAAGKSGPGEAESSESHVWFSDAGNAESWHTIAPEANYVQLSPGDGESITAACYWNGMVFVFKETKLYIFYSVTTDEEGSPEFNFRVVELGTRIVAGGAAVPGADGVFFLAEDGVFATNGGPPTLLSSALSPLGSLRTILGPAGESRLDLENHRWSQCERICYRRRRIYVSAEKVVYVYDLDRGAWLIWSAALRELVPWKGELYFTGQTEAYVFRYRQTQEEDVAMEKKPTWQSGFYDLGSEDEKSLVESKLMGKGTILLSSYKDNSAAAGFKDTVAISESSLQGRSRSAQTGTTFSHKIQLEPNAYVTRLVRYLREEREPTTRTSTK